MAVPGRHPNYQLWFKTFNSFQSQGQPLPSPSSAPLLPLSNCGNPSLIAY